MYSGEYWDDTTQLQYLRARWYDPSMGRFINEDTYEGELNNPLSLNLYTYVHNNPLKYVDPSGNKPVIWYDKEKDEYTYDASVKFLDGVQLALGIIPFSSLIDAGMKKVHGSIRGVYFTEISNKDIKRANEKLGITTGLITLDIIGQISNSKVKKAIGNLASGVGGIFTAVDIVSYFSETDISWLVADLVSPGLMVSNRREQITLRYIFASTLINEMISNGSLEYSYNEGKLTHNLSQADIDAINDAMLNFMLATGAYENKGDY